MNLSRTEAAVGDVSVDVLMSNSELEDTMRRLTPGSDDRSRLPAALSCLKSATEPDGDFKQSGDSCSSVPQQTGDPSSHIDPASCSAAVSGSPSSAFYPTNNHGRSISISVVPCSDEQRHDISTDEMSDAFAPDPTSPPATRPLNMCTAKSSSTSLSPSRELLQLLPNIMTIRSKSHESQVANRIEDPTAHKAHKRKKVLASVQVNGCGNSPDISNMRSPLPSARTPGSSPATPTLMDNLAVQRSSPQTLRRDIGLAVTHRFSTKSWLSQTCQVCCKSMMFGVKCKHCKLKCHNKCTRDAPSCRISFLTMPRMRRAESVPSDINNQIDHTVELPHQFCTLPKAVTKREAPSTLNRLDSSSNPSSATSSSPSSPVHYQHNSTSSVSATPPLNPSPRGPQDNCFDFPDVPTSTCTAAQHSGSCCQSGESWLTVADGELPTTQSKEKVAEQHYLAEDEETAGRCEEKNLPIEEFDDDRLEELPTSICRRGAIGRWRSPTARKASQTSIYLQEWDIPYEQLQLDELIGKGRWGKVHKGRWHGEVAIRLLEIDGTNQDHLKVFKKEVMNYRQTRHENVVLFMGACMAPPHLAIITSFCKGLTLYSFVRERGNMLDINKTRQIAQEIVKGMGYLHAKGIVHKDLKSKNVFYDANRVVITDFGLFGMSGVVQEGRRKNVVQIPHGWIYYLAPEIVQKMSPAVDEDRLPFSKGTDVYAFGTIWYELQVGDWPLTHQPAEAKIWLFGSSTGNKKVLEKSNLGKEVTEILSTCWSCEAADRPSFSQLAGMLERLPKLNRRLSHPGHFWKSPEYVS
ncbi:kinase suppressor of Ras 1-like isoform X1 [Thalassophryne amazonica]|uniref:kinase suppressor of Ras 1-like isoform X1 n=1 Tax=Thalassophryne amazonica TaxID=390379 RepID=UPI0014716CBD|nr:kinase suppressor of Ras 1-like isoform X1 [Thalassophryne amazonica]